MFFYCFLNYLVQKITSKACFYLVSTNNALVSNINVLKDFFMIFKISAYLEAKKKQKTGKILLLLY